MNGIMMVPAVLLLLFLSWTAVPAAAADDQLQTNSSLDVSEIIAKANEGITAGLMHGDIRMRTGRNAVPCTATGCMWRKRGRYVIVPVVISRRYTRYQRYLIIKALVSFHRSTCVRFVWRWRQRDYLYFYSGNGCWSYLGRQGGGQLVSLKSRGCIYTSTVQHEVLHALGFHHEQVRSDRDRYVSILTQNIRPGLESNFAKVQTNNLYTPYDFNSVMHYSKYAFSKNGQPTIVAKSNPNLVFGNARYMSVNDIRRVNRLYKCWGY